MLFKSQLDFKVFLALPVIAVLVFTAGDGYTAKQKKEKNKKMEGAYVMTEAELQSQVMSYADRFGSMMVAAFNVYDAQSPPPEQRRTVRRSTVYAMSSALTTAVEADPEVALLDMVTMVVLGRMIYEEHWRKKFGPQVDPILRAFKQAETDIWQITDKVLTPSQQKDLRALIQQWRREHPEVTFFAYVRFSDFASERRKSTLEKAKVRGILKNVQNATRQVEEARLLAERGMFLGTRLPLMAGAFADFWISQLIANPDVSKILGDIHQLSEVSGRMVAVAEKLPDQISDERDKTIKQAVENINALVMTSLDKIATKVSAERIATIEQFMKELSGERQKAIQDFLSQEKLIRGLMTDMLQTLESGNKLLTSANALAEHLNLGSNAATPKTSSEPFKIKDYQATLMEASTVIKELDGLVKTVDQLMVSPGWENSLPRIRDSFEQIESKGSKWINHLFLLVVALILIFLVGAVFAMLAYRYVSQRMFEMKHNDSVR